MVGTAMTSDGNGWYSYDIYGFDEVKVIFSDNGANQIPQQNETGCTVTGENGSSTVVCMMLNRTALQSISMTIITGAM